MQKENTAPTRASPFESIFSAQMSDTVPFELGPEHLHFHRMSANSFSSIKRLCFPERRDRIYIREIQDTLEHRHYRNISIPSMMARQNLPQGNPGNAGTQTLTKHINTTHHDETEFATGKSRTRWNTDITETLEEKVLVLLLSKVSVPRRNFVNMPRQVI